jgi:Protein of unknown function (DUF2637)
MSTWHTIVSFTDRISSGMWAGLMLANIALTIITWGVARRRVRRAGERAAHPERFADSNRKKDVALTVASLVPAALFWGMVLAGSFQGLVAFGRNVLRWNGGAEYLVPGTLDGVSVTFAFLAFRAIHKHRDPARSQRVVWTASLSSATVNFAYEYGFTHNVIAGFYLAALSVFGMVIFHEFLAQFEEGAEYVRRNKRPPWGLRWFTSPYSTFCGAIAWENFPPEDGTIATVRNGLANLERARSIKRNAAEERTVEQHSRALAAAHRKAELARAKTDPTFVPVPRAGEAGVADSVVPANAEPAPASLRVPAVALPARPVRAAATVRTEDVPSDVKVPTTPATVAQWLQTWMQMCADSELVSLTDEERARAVYNLSGRQLRSIRSAALSGSLARRAAELGVDLPDGFAETVSERINGHEFEGIAA